MLEGTFLVIKTAVCEPQHSSLDPAVLVWVAPCLLPNLVPEPDLVFQGGSWGLMSRTPTITRY